MVALSIIIPVYNEAENIQPLHEQLLRYCKDDYEIIFVNDGSTDDTISLIETLAEKDHHYKCVSLSRNFGHQNALMAGMENAGGDFIIMMDGDLQHPPELIPVMMEKLANGNDVVITTRKKPPISLY